MSELIFSILSVVVVANLILGLIIFSRGYKIISNVIFGIISLISSVWGVAIIGFYSQYSTNYNWIHITHVSALLIPFFFIIFSLNFPQENNSIKIPILFTSIPCLILIPIILFTDKIIGSTTGLTYEINNGYFVYCFIVMSYFIISFLFLYSKYRLTNDREVREQIKYVLIGTILSSSLAIFPDLIFPLFGIYEYTWLGPIFTLMMVISLFIAMLKYKLFNIKILLTELVSAVIVITLLLEIFFVKSYSELFIKTLILILVTFFSYILIKSVIKEVSQREKIELLATDLQKANARLTELDKQKSEFVSFATHQLRAPLTAMKGYASLILEGDMGVISDDVKNAIVRIYESSGTLTNIVDDYLNISRIELGSMKYSFEKIDLKNLVGDVMGELKPNIEKSKLDVKFDCDKNKKYTVKVDPDKFKQIIINIIDNSMKYTPKGKITVSLELNAGKVLFSVKDTGIGIAPEVLPKLFMKFSRATNGSKQNIHGTGLGLFVAKEIVAAHKGKIWAESPGEGKGSSFYVEVDQEI